MGAQAAIADWALFFGLKQLRVTQPNYFRVTQPNYSLAPKF